MVWRSALLVVPLVAAGCGTGAESDSAGVLAVEFSDFESGEPATLGEYEGVPLVVNLWAAWCPSCIHEMPDFEEVSQEYAGRVEFVGIGIDDDRGAAEQLVEETGVTYRLGIDDDGVFTGLLGAVAMPTTAFIGADGEVIEVRGGQLSADALRAQIEQHLLAGDGAIAAPGIDDNRIRRSALPSVWPKPRSNGSMTTLANKSLTGVTLTTRGFRNSCTDSCMGRYLPDYLEYSSTTRFSLMSGRISSRSGNDFKTPDIFFASTSTQSGRPTWPAISIAL